MPKRKPPPPIRSRHPRGRVQGNHSHCPRVEPTAPPTVHGRSQADGSRRRLLRSLLPPKRKRGRPGIDTLRRQFSSRQNSGASTQARGRNRSVRECTRRPSPDMPKERPPTEARAQRSGSFSGPIRLGSRDFGGPLLTAAGLLIGLKGAEKVDTGAYSYLFQASYRFPY
jgi:hypothetical protein